MAFTFTLLAAAVLSGCAVGPDFQKPAMMDPGAQFVRQPSSVLSSSASSAAASAQEPDAQFWRAFNDPLLDELVARALVNNRDLHAAFARWQAAQALLEGTRADRLPTVTANAGGTQQRLARDQASPGQPRSSRSYQAGVAASWEADLFGRVRRAIEAGEADAQASAADIAAMQLVIAAQLAGSYVELRGLQMRLALSQDNERNQRRTVELAEKRFSAGLSTDFDLRRARAQWQATLATIPSLEAQAAFAQHRIATLAGEMPGAWLEQLSVAPAALPAAPALIDPGTPADLLRRRPDIAAAEARLHGATARIGVATADLFPRVSLGAMLGSFTLAGGSLFKAASSNSNVVLGIDWTFLDAGRVRARIAASEAGADEALAQYQQTVLGAMEETENALVRLQKNREQGDLLALAASEQEQAEWQADRLYRAGSVSFYEVLDAQKQRLAAQDAALQSRVAGLQAALALYKSLAGGWGAGNPSVGYVELEQFSM